MIPVKRNPTNEDRIEYLRMQEIVREIVRADAIERTFAEEETRRSSVLYAMNKSLNG